MKTRKIKNLTVVKTGKHQCEVYLLRNGESRLVGYYKADIILLSKDDDIAEKELVMGYRTAPFCDYTELNRRWQISKRKLS